MDDDWAEPIGKDESQYKLSGLITRKGMKFRYLYDFGDSWDHDILLEDSDYSNTDWPYPIYCLTGKRACPPEDSGGIYGYYDICEEEGETLGDDNWYADFDPEEFDHAEINTSFKIPKRKKSPAKSVVKTPARKKASSKRTVAAKPEPPVASPPNRVEILPK